MAPKAAAPIGIRAEFASLQRRLDEDMRRIAHKVDKHTDCINKLGRDLDVIAPYSPAMKAKKAMNGMKAMKAMKAMRAMKAMKDASPLGYVGHVVDLVGPGLGMFRQWTLGMFRPKPAKI